MIRDNLKFYSFITSISLPAFAFVLSGCAIFGGGGGPEYSRAKDYQLSAPPQWREAKDSGESDRAYQLPSGALVSATSSCNRFSGQTAEVLTKQVLIGTRNVKVKKRTKLQIATQEALHSSLTATLEGIPFHLEVIVVSIRECVYDFQLIYPKPISGEDKADFVAFAKSLNHGTN